MTANHKLSHALSNLGLYRFRELLSYKQESFGFLLTIVDRGFPSSKSGCDPAPSYGARERAPSTCSICGNIQDMPLCERVYHCQNCGQVMDRDLNASINLESWTNNADGLSVNPERLVLSEVEGSRRVNACGQEGAVSLG